ncbi:MAG: apolipoprotein N-acyltransferase [Rhodospirillaceae bacterium]|nr:apolipoprotein N-acyltransferase [Rhodospirillaceae bacterium]
MADEISGKLGKNTFVKTASVLERLSGWRLYLLMFFSGVLAVFAFAPLHLVFLLYPAFSILIFVLLAQKSFKRAFIIGWWWGGGYFAAGLYWVTMALLVDAESFAWLIPFAIFGFAVGFGLFVAIAAGLSYKFAKNSPASAVLLFAASWAVLEWVRSWLLTGFPWNLLGSVWAFSDNALQGAAFIGTYGLGLLTVIAASAPVVLFRGKIKFAILGILIPATLFAVGAVRLADAQTENVDGVRLRLVQPNIPQRDKWNRDLLQSHLLSQIEMGAGEAANGKAPTHIIWGETQAPFFLAEHQPWIEKIASQTPGGGLSIIGAPRRLSGDNEPFSVANSMLVIDADQARITNTYDKFHLVPFGEYVPLSDILPMEKITSGTGAFTPGPGITTMNLKGLPPVSPLICYEVIFPLAVAKSDPVSGARPKWLLNLTNDAWYGKTQGPHQHFALSRMRAVEEGLPLVRVANSGISGVVDGYGRVVAKAPLGARAIVDADLPKEIAQTVYSSIGNAIPLGLAIFLAIGGIVVAKCERKKCE